MLCSAKRAVDNHFITLS